ncbi:MAG: hypothetical protein GY801_08135 [bacterium]|nr:hypothetical protein [bacterium]
MKARVTLGPEHRRDRKLRQRFGDQLVYVRDRCDEERKKRNTPVERIIDEAEWEPRRKTPDGQEIVGVRIERKERALQKRVKQAGAIWNQQRTRWERCYEKAIELGIQDRVVRVKMSSQRIVYTIRNNILSRTGRIVYTIHFGASPVDDRGLYRIYDTNHDRIYETVYPSSMGDIHLLARFSAINKLSEMNAYESCHKIYVGIAFYTIEVFMHDFMYDAQLDNSYG